MNAISAIGRVLIALARHPVVQEAAHHALRLASQEMIRYIRRRNKARGTGDRFH